MSPKTTRAPMVQRGVRAPEPMWDQADREADADGVGYSEVIRRAMRYYFERGAAGRPDTSRTEKTRDNL